MRPSKERLLEVVTYVEPGSDDVTFTHAVFAQCFLPIRKLPKSQKLYEVRHGRAALAVLAGALLEPASKRFVAMDIPSGSAARVALAHINNHIIRSKSLDEAVAVPMGESLRDFMDYQGVNICGTNGKELSRQIHNLAAARISLGVWSGEHARQINAQIADTIDFWLEKDRRQRTLWQPIMRVSEPYATAVREHCVPHDMRALIGLYKNTRAMDIYVWLSYRLPRIPNHHPLFLRYVDLKPVFGTSIRELRKFRELFRHALRDALAWYRDARVGIEPDGIRLFNSPSPVPIDVARSPYGRTVAGGRRRLRVVTQPDD
jgi:hypothetical protein